MATQKYPKPSEMPKVGPGGVIWDVPENREFLLTLKLHQNSHRNNFWILLRYTGTTALLAQ